MTLVHYFNDGAASQYKNCKNLRNLCFHESDFGIKAEWNFFATSHGKSPCDGIGGTVKRLAAWASLQASVSGHILSPEDLFNFAVANIKGITFVYASSEEIHAHEQSLIPRFSTIKTIVGTRSQHRFVPVSKDEILLYRLSEDNCCTRTAVSCGVNIVERDNIIRDQCQPGKYVAAVYGNDWYIGLIYERLEEHDDLRVQFMKNNRVRNHLRWAGLDECWIPIDNILRIVPTPQVAGLSARQYVLQTNITDDCANRFKDFKKTNA